MTSAAGPADLELLNEEGAAELARNYAQALLNAADAEGRGEAILGELEELVDDVWSHQPDFARLLISGISDRDRRSQVIREVFEAHTDPILYRFLQVLGARDRLVLLPLVAGSAREIWNRQHNRVPVTIRTARPLDDSLRSTVQAKVAAMLGGASPIVAEEVDPSLIGGLVIQIGDQLYDASVRHRLELVRQSLLRGRVREVRRRNDLVVE